MSPHIRQHKHQHFVVMPVLALVLVGVSLLFVYNFRESLAVRLNAQFAQFAWSHIFSGKECKQWPKDPAFRVTLPSPSLAHIPSTILLSPIDTYFARLPVVVVLGFDYLLDEKSFAESLQKTLVCKCTPHASRTHTALEEALPVTVDFLQPLFPELVGRVVRIAHDTLAIDTSDGHVPIFVKSDDTATSVPELAHITDPLLKKYLRVEPWGLWSSQKCLTLSLTHLTAINKSVLGVCMSHSVGDASSLAFFLNTWSQIHTGTKTIKEISRPNADRTPMTIEGDREKTEALLRDRELCVRRCCWNLHSFISNVFNTVKDVIILRDPVVVTRCFSFTPAMIERLKENAMKGRAGSKLIGRIVSTNDVITAFLLHTYAQLRTFNHPDTPLPVMYLIESRRFLEKFYNKAPGFYENYFGNCITPRALWLTKAELLSCDFSEVVLHVRNSVDSFTISDFEQSHALLHRVNHGKYGLEQTANVMAGPARVGFFSTSWTKFSLYTFDLGHGGPSRVATIYSFAPWLCQSVKHRNDEIQWMASMPSNIAKRFDKLWQQFCTEA